MPSITSPSAGSDRPRPLTRRRTSPCPGRRGCHETGEDEHPEWAAGPTLGACRVTSQRSFRPSSTTSTRSCAANITRSAWPSRACSPRVICCSTTCPAPARRRWPRRSPARSAGTWKRVQFTPDLLPSDITGVMVYDQSSGAVQLPGGPGLRQRDDRRRDQPWQPQDAVGAARGDGGTAGHGRRRRPAGPTTLLRARHAESPRLPGHVPAPRRAARPVHDADQPRLHRSQHRGARARGLHARVPRPGRRRGDRRRRRSRA